jgi:tetratricopeptide (TPR) repeat protein
MSTTPDGATADPALRCEEARQCAEHGDVERAALLFEEVLALGDVPQRAQAALGLAVVREDAGEVNGARDADWIAIRTQDPEYAPRAAYHLALSYERTGERDEAATTWRMVVDFGNPAYLPPAWLALAQLADDKGDFDTARGWWEQVLAADDVQYTPVAAHDLAQRLLERGETAKAQRLLAEVLRRIDPAEAPYAHARLAVTMGMAHLDQAIGAFSAALGGETTDGDVRALAVELLARTLPLRGRDEEAREVWDRGLADPRISEQVHARLRREFGEAGSERLWWEPYVESALRGGELPALTGEVFGALDHMYSLIALRHAEGNEGIPAETYELLGEVSRVPSEYDWGATLHGSFTDRLREAMGTPEATPPPD